MEKTTITVELCGGRWLCNGKQISELNHVELRFFELFFQELKINQ